ncbi:MAG: leucine-rich repeat protein [Bacteroidales bacterium]|nr:leucine-rich repeat protein [Clostridium sp.]MCM1203893.1 leucine-rich repeat protein [Bacteroidales bacterium]
MEKIRRSMMLFFCLAVLNIGIVYAGIPVYATEAGGDEEVQTPVTFTVEKEGYSLVYEVSADNENVVGITDCEVAVPDELVGEKLCISLDGTVKYEGKTYYVGEIKAGAFKDCKIKKYIISQDIHTVDLQAFDTEDIVALKQITYSENYETKNIVLENFASEAIKYLLFCGGEDAGEKMKEILSVDALPDNVVKVENPEMGVLEVKAEETGHVREDAYLSTAVVSMVDTVTGEEVNGTVSWDDVDVNGSKKKADQYKMDSSQFDENDISLAEYGFTFSAENYIPYSAKIRIANSLIVAEQGDFRLKLELFDSEAGKTATIISCELKDAQSQTDVLEIPQVITGPDGDYTVTKVAGNAFQTLNTVHTYILPNQKIEFAEGAFYDNNTDENRVVLLRVLAESEANLPVIAGSYQKNDGKKNRFAMLFAPAVKAVDLRNRYANTVGWNNADEFLQIAEQAVRTDKLMYGGNKTMDSNVYYDVASGKNTMAYVNTTVQDMTPYKDFLTDANVATTVDWGTNAAYKFNYKDGAQQFDYLIKSAGYISLKKTQSFDPQSASGYTYKYDSTAKALSVTGYKGKETELVLSRSETDAYGTYPVTAISGRAFGSDSYTKLTIPANITSVEADAFVGSNYMKIVVDKNNKNFVAIDDFLYTADKKMLIAAPSANGNISLPEGTEQLGNYAFAGCKRLISVIIPSTVTMIGTSNNGSYTFAWMSNFETIKFSSSKPPVIMGGQMLNSTGIREIWCPTGTKAAYEQALQSVGIYLNENTRLVEWNPTYNTLVSMDGSEVGLLNPPDSTKTYKWTSSNPNVAEVTGSGSQGKVTAVGNGEAVITAKAADGTTYKWTINVSLSEKAYNTSFAVKNVTLGKKDGKKKDQVTVDTVSVPRKTKIKSVKVKNSKIATVKIAKNKTSIIITSAKKTGTTTVTVTDMNGKTATLKITVKKAPTAKSFKLAKKTVTLKKGKTYQIALKKNVASGKLTYTLSKASKKIVSVSKTGLVKAKKKGSATITVTSYNGKKATLKVKVK